MSPWTLAGGMLLSFGLSCWTASPLDASFVGTAAMCFTQAIVEALGRKRS